MRTPVILVAGQRDTDAVVGAMLQTPGTLVVEHRFDGHVVRRTTASLSDGVLTSTENGLELAHGCVSCTIRNDLLVLLRRLHRRDDVDRIVVHLAPWLEPEPICLAIKHVRVRVAPGYIDGPAALDVAPAPVMSAAKADVDAATRPAATIALMKFMVGLHLGERSARCARSRSPRPFRCGR